MLDLIIKSKPQKKIQSDNIFRKKMIELTHSKIFDHLVTFAIITNCLVLGITWPEMSDELRETSQYINVFFLFFFFLEMVIKIIAEKEVYFFNLWNRLDFFVIALDASFSVAGMISGPSVPDLWRLIHVLPVFRMLRLLKKIEAIKIILFTVLNTLSSLVNVGGLLMLLLFVYSVMGVTLFATVKIESPLDPTIVNFQTFINAFLILFRAATGENWHLILNAVSRERSLSF